VQAALTIPIVVLALVLGLASKAHAPTLHRGAPLPLSVVEALIAPWALIWQVPALLVLIVGAIESRFHPLDVNDTDPRAVKRGGAWGMFQITLATARDLLSRVSDFHQYAASRRWDGSGPSLLDPGLNTMLASWYLASLWHEFGDYPEALAAYHQGPQKVRDMLAAGRAIPDQLPPKGRAYVLEALAAKRQLEQRGYS
jgi:soluble lytic murein transglycosylase-like protein